MFRVIAACYSIHFQVSHFCHKPTNDSRRFIITNKGLTQSVKEPFTFFIFFDLNSV